MAISENTTTPKWIILDPSGRRVNPHLLSESAAKTELTALNTKQLTEGKAERYAMKQYLVG